MSIFSTIRERIFGRQEQPGQAGQASPDATPELTARPAEAAPALAAVPTSSPEPQPAPPPAVDVQAMLAERARNHPEKLDWQHSIVDLMKLLGLDSSLQHRRELARELHYPMDTDDTASMNVWLHREVMRKLADNRGQVPDALR